MKINIDRLSKFFGDKAVLKNCSFDIIHGEFLSIIGPSGVGKTTLLNILAGFQNADSGTLFFDGKPQAGEPVIMIFQDFMLFPHIRVRENIAYGMHSRNNFRRLYPDPADWKRKRKLEIINSEIKRQLENFGLSDLGERFPAQLSAGQRQRVALARGLILRPGLLLLDEPFANLDQNLKMETAQFIRNIQRDFGVTTLAVTHDLQEAFAMSDRIGVMLEGKLLQLSDVETLYRFPSSIQVGAFLGPINIIDSETAALCETAKNYNDECRTHLPVAMLVRAEAIQLTPDENGPARVISRRFQGSLIQLEVKINDRRLTVYRLNSDIVENQRVRLHIREFVSLENQALPTVQELQ